MNPKDKERMMMELKHMARRADNLKVDLCTNYQDIRMTTSEARANWANGNFCWGTVNWRFVPKKG